MENTNNNNEIPLKELVMLILRRWKTVVACTAVTLLIAAVYVFAIANPLYESSVKGVVNIPASVENKYGEYFFPSTTVSDYMGRTSNEETLTKTIKALELDTTAAKLRSQISVATNQSSKQFTITVKAESPEKAKAVAAELSQTFIKDVCMDYKEYAINTFIKTCASKSDEYTETLQIETLKQIALEEDLAEIPPVVTLKKLLAEDPQAAARIILENGLDISDIDSDTVLFEEFINPYYTETQIAIIAQRLLVHEAEALIARNDILYKELQAELAGVKHYRETGDESQITNTTLDVLGASIQLTSEASFPAGPVSPRKVRILAIALFLGLLIGVSYVLLRHYWKSH